MFNCYEAFIHLVDSMFNLSTLSAQDDPGTSPQRATIASLNFRLSSHVWRQDHNGLSHPGPRR